MNIERTKLDGVCVLEPKIFQDLRGQFIKTFNQEAFESERLPFQLAESYYSTSKKNVIRGMHFQIPPMEHTKLVYVTRGRILDAVLDIRHGSPTYGECISVELSERNRKMIYIPIGFAHGFLSLEDDSCVVYCQTSMYSTQHDAGVLFSSFGMDWGTVSPIMSDRDKGFPTLAEYQTPFTYQGDKR